MAGPYGHERHYTGPVETSAGRQARSEVEKLELEVEKLRLVVEAMWRIMQEQHGYTDEQLMARMAQLDISDGKLDGRKKTKSLPRDCPKCRRKTSKKNPRCMYCGEVLIVDPFD